MDRCFKVALPVFVCADIYVGSVLSEDQVSWYTRSLCTSLTSVLPPSWPCLTFPNTPAHSCLWWPVSVWLRPVFLSHYSQYLVIANISCSLGSSLAFSSRAQREVTKPAPYSGSFFKPSHTLLSYLSVTFVKTGANRCLCSVNSLASEGLLKLRPDILV